MPRRRRPRVYILYALARVTTCCFKTSSCVASCTLLFRSSSIAIVMASSSPAYRQSKRNDDGVIELSARLKKCWTRSFDQQLLPAALAKVCQVASLCKRLFTLNLIL